MIERLKMADPILTREKQLRLFPPSMCVLYCTYCGEERVHFIQKITPLVIKCNSCGCSFDEEE